MSEEMQASLSEKPESTLSLKWRCQGRIDAWLSNNEHDVPGWEWRDFEFLDYLRFMELRVENPTTHTFYTRRVSVNCSDAELATALSELAALIAPREANNG